MFGEVAGSRFTANALGDMILAEWAALETVYPALILEECQLMPDHFHGLLTLGIDPTGNTSRPSQSAVIGRFKSITARRYRELRDEGLCLNTGPTCWQSRFHDTIIRNERHFDETVMYMLMNPRRWTQKHEETSM